MNRDPVCEMYVDPERSNWVAEHAGKDHYFCSEACQRAFASDPEKFLSEGTGGQAHGTQMGSMGGCGGGSGGGRRGYLNTAIMLILILLLLFR